MIPLTSFNVADVREQLVGYLNQLGFVARDADVTDLQLGEDKSLRFKVGTAYNEVTIIVVYEDQDVPNRTLRVTRIGQVAQAEGMILNTVQKHWQRTTNNKADRHVVYSGDPESWMD